MMLDDLKLSSVDLHDAKWTLSSAVPSLVFWRHQCRSSALLLVTRQTCSHISIYRCYTFYSSQG